MMQRKSRNAVVALMAACTRNDPALVTWLIETFADIKVVHIMQAMMIACDRGLLRVVKALLGGPLVVAGQDVVGGGVGGSGGSGAAGKKEKSSLGKKKDVSGGSSTVAVAGSSRSLFRRWLASQYQQILDMTQKPAPNSSATKSPAGPGVAEPNNEDDEHEEATPTTTEDDSSALPRFDSFPFIFLMESSPLFRHYYQTLNTLSSCQFMMKRNAVHPIGGGSVRTAAATTTSPGSPPNSSRTQQQQQQSSAPEHDGASNNAATNNSSNNPPGSSNSAPNATATPSTPPIAPLQRRASASASTSYHTSFSPPQPTAPSKHATIPQPRQAHQIPPQEIKREIIHLMLSPILETLGPISVRKALDRLPKDSWWPLDHDVRMIVDQEARKDMVSLVMAMKKRQKQNQKQREFRVVKAMRERSEAMVGGSAEEEESSGAEGVGGVVVEGGVQGPHGRHGRHERQEHSRVGVIDLLQLSGQRRKEHRQKGKSNENVSQEEGEVEKKGSVSDKWHKASGPFRRVRKWVVERKKKSAEAIDIITQQHQQAGDEEEERQSRRDGGVQSIEKSRPFDLTTTRPAGLKIIN
jgi:hypothetical protein